MAGHPTIQFVIILENLYTYNLILKFFWLQTPSDLGAHMPLFMSETS